VQDFLVFLAQSLRLTGQYLDHHLQPVPWPLAIAVLLPFYAMALSAFVWWMRGTAWPVLCSYPVTTKRRPCGNTVPGEWHRCRLHRRSWQRRTDGHVVVAGLRRWKTVTRSGSVVLSDKVGRGLVRLHGKSSTLLYRRGFARPPSDVLRFLPDWWRETQQRWREARGRLRHVRTSPGSWRTILWSHSPLSEGVADRLAVVVVATRTSLYLVACGLCLVVLAIALPSGAAQYVDYAAAVCFVMTWAVLKEGVWLADERWFRLARQDLWRWGWPWFLFSVLGGALVTSTP
jgi:hypothetical protein